MESCTALLSQIDLYLKTITSTEWKGALAADNHNRQLFFARGAQLNDVTPLNIFVGH